MPPLVAVLLIMLFMGLVTGLYGLTILAAIPLVFIGLLFAVLLACDAWDAMARAVSRWWHRGC